MPQLIDMAGSQVKKILVYGAPKSGKTKLVGGLAERFKLVWFDFENGWETLLQLPPELKRNIRVISIPDTRTNPVAMETMLKVIKGAPVDICVEHGKVNCMVCKRDGKPVERVCLNELGPGDCVVMDSLSQLTNSGIATITRNQPDDYKLQFDDWGNLGRLMDTVLSYVQAAPYNVAAISHETETTRPDGTKDGKFILVPTAGTRNFSRNCAKYFGEVVFCEVKNKRHVFGSSTTYNNGMLTGGRSSVALEGKADAKLLDLWDIPSEPLVPDQSDAATSTPKSALLAKFKK